MKALAVLFIIVCYISAVVYAPQREDTVIHAVPENDNTDSALVVTSFTVCDIFADSLGEALRVCSNGEMYLRDSISAIKAVIERMRLQTETIFYLDSVSNELRQELRTNQPGFINHKTTQLKS